MTKEEFLHHYLTQGCVDAIELERDEYGCLAIVVIEHEGTFYKSKVEESWGRVSTEGFTVEDEPTVVVHKRVMDTQYTSAEEVDTL